jgi:glutamate 5-kinase
MIRTFKRPIKRVVIKVGSSVIADYTLKARSAQLRSLVGQMSALNQQGIEVILVSSGAIVLGMGQLGLKTRPSDLASLQALAAVGQTVLMKTYSDFFKKAKAQCAQVLLTWEDFDSRNRYNNASHTLKAILAHKVIPIINENDTISTDEIKFGDNDKLSALVAGLVHADLLILLSDVKGLYEKRDGKTQYFTEVKEINADIQSMARGSLNTNISKGGMSAKLEAIKIATQANIPCVIASGATKNVLASVINGELVGTFFFSKEDKTLARRHWISFIAKPKGTITVDDGAVAALLMRGKSLLLPGVVKCEGHFKADDVVIIQDKDSSEIARGIVQYSLVDILNIYEKKGQREVIHCDDLVLCKR